MFNANATLNAQKAKKVSAPVLSPDEEENDSGEFGSISWYLVLASFIDQRVALAAVDGWGGDSYVGYRKNNRTCISLAFEGDTRPTRRRWLPRSSSGRRRSPRTPSR